MTASLLALASLACTDPAEDKPDLPVDTADTFIDWPDDTDEPGTDEDTDGWTVEEGDCDDTNIFVNPGRDEDPTDGLDNDCDGRVDEEFSGLMVLQQGNGVSPARVLFLDDFGAQEREVLLDDPDLVPFFLTEGVGGGWLVGTLGSHDATDPVQVALYEVDPDGRTSLLADFTDAEVWAFGLWGITTHPDGYYLAATGDSLQAVEPGSGVLTPLATWDPETELYAFDVDVDLLTGEVGVFGYYGGFATLDAAGAVMTRALGNAGAPELVLFSGKRWGARGWYAGAFDADGFGVFRFNTNGGRWLRELSFEGQDTLWNPRFMTVDDINGGVYITTTEATYPTVWRIPAEGGPASAFFLSDIRDDDFALWDLYTRF